MDVAKDGSLGDSIMLDHVVTPQLMEASNLGCAEAGVLSKPKDVAEDDAADRDDDAAAECVDKGGDFGVQGDGGTGGVNGVIVGAMNLMTGKKVKWTTEEKKWLWECYVSVGWRGKQDGFQEKVYRR